MDDFETCGFLPSWAIGKTNGTLQPGAQLCTRDGRRCGNAVITGPISEYGHWPVLTDAGTMMNLLPAEIAELFWPPQWLMLLTTAPGYRHLLEPPAD